VIIRNESAHVGQLAEEDIVHCCKEPVEVRGVGMHPEVRR